MDNAQRYTGIVQENSRRGTELGFPTINIPLGDDSLSGIYAAKVKVGEEKYWAAAYADQKRNVLEAHLLDLNKDLYGWNVTIELFEKIRETRQFKNDAELQKAIAEDIVAVRAYFTKRSLPR